MTSLDRAVTLVQVNDVSVAVAKKLHLNVLGSVEEALNEDGAVAERRLGLGGGALEGILELFLLPDNSHTTSTTTKSGLDDDWEAVLVSEALDLFKLLDRARSTGHNRYLAFHGQLTGRNLVTEGVDGLGGWSDKLSALARVLWYRVGVGFCSRSCRHLRRPLRIGRSHSENRIQGG